MFHLKRYLKKSAFSQLSPQEKQTLRHEISHENFNKIAILAPVLFVIELVLLITPDQLFEYSRVILPFVLMNIFLIPMIFLVKSKLDTLPPLIPWVVQILYAFSFLFLGSFLSLESMGIADFIHMYLMAIIGVSVFMSFSGWIRSILFSVSYGAYFLLLPHYQPNPEIRFVVLANILIFNILAWIIGALFLKSKCLAFIDRKSLMEKSLALKDMAQRDSMTRLYNHETAFIKLKEEINRAKRINYPLSIIIVDIDDFKQINDRYGHPTGDSIIRKIAFIIQEQTRSTDIVGRYGGEEFIIILPDTHLSAAMQLSERIRQSIISTPMNIDMPVTLSGGVCEYHGESLDDFIRMADKRLYDAKNNGKNQFIHRSPRM
jgi:diguanylate cyclase